MEEPGNKIKLSATEKAEKFLRSQIAEGIWKKGDRLPTYYKLAQLAGVGQKNMNNALATLQREKIIIYKRKTGTYVGQTIPLKNRTLPRKLKWEKIKEQIQKDIYIGIFDNTECIPSVKELMGRYGTGPRLMRKAVKSLIDDKILVNDKQQYRVRRHAVSPVQNTIILLTDARVLNGELWSKERIAFSDFVKGLEKECNLKNIRLAKHNYGDPFHVDEKVENTLGFVVWHDHFLNPVYHELVLQLKQYKKPVAIQVWLNVEEIEAHGFYSNTPDFFISDIQDDVRVGRALGKFLIDRQHKKICFLAPTRQHRLVCKGLVDAFAMVGISDAVVPLIREEMSESDLQSLLIEKDLALETFIQEELMVLDQSRKNIENLPSGPLTERCINQIHETRFARHCLSWWMPVFRKALTIPAVTAWVCSDELTAFYGALAFCKAEKIAVPQKLGIIGTDDMLESQTHNLTTYRRDFYSSGRKMINLIVYPEHGRKTLCKNGTNIFELEGMVIDRGSA